MAVLRDSWVLVGHLNNVICSTKLKETIKQKSKYNLVVNTASADGRAVGTFRCKGICMPMFLSRMCTGLVLNVLKPSDAYMGM